MLKESQVGGFAKNLETVRLSTFYVDPAEPLQWNVVAAVLHILSSVMMDTCEKNAEPLESLFRG